MERGGGSSICPRREVSGNHHTAISLACISSGFGFPLNRRDFAVRYLKSLGGRTNHRLVISEQEVELRDYERLCETSQAMVYAVMSRLMLRRLTRV